MYAISYAFFYFISIPQQITNIVFEKKEHVIIGKNTQNVKMQDFQLQSIDFLNSFPVEFVD